MQLKTLPCPPCEVSVPVTCLGGHETRPWPCHMSRPSSCGRVCGRPLPCKNHTCELTCHKVGIINEDGTSSDGTPCMECENECLFPRPAGCTHTCPQPCHPAPCKPCKQLVRISCHCSISTLYRHCVDLTSASSEERDELLRCGNQCPKNVSRGLVPPTRIYKMFLFVKKKKYNTTFFQYPCGHRCINDCHPGACTNGETCSKKVRLWCKCKRIKKDFLCSFVQKEQVTVDCDDVCESLKNERNQAQEAMIAKKREAEELRNREEIEKFEKKFKPRRKKKDKYDNSRQSQGNTGYKRKIAWILTIIIGLVGVTIAYMSTSDLNVLGS